MIALAAFLAVSFAGGAAFAYFRSAGGGSGGATTGRPISVTITASASPADLFPGNAGTVKFTLTNNNAFTAHFTSVTAASVTSSNQTNCAAANVQVAALPYTISNLSVSPGQTTGTNTISGLISMASGAPSACQGVSFSVSLTLSGQSS